MEKIYVEKEQQQRQQQKNKRLNSLNVSLGLSFAVAFIAIASILFVSLSGTSYAMDEEDVAGTITTKAITGWVSPSNSPSGHYVTPIFMAESGGKTFPVFCLESKNAFNGGKELDTREKITDNGLIYLTTELNDLSVTGDDSDGHIKRWLTQSAIWAYLALTGDEGSAEADDAETYYNTVKATEQVCVATESTDTNCAGKTLIPATAGTKLYTKYGVEAIISKALEFHGAKSEILSMNVNKTGDTFTLTDNDKSYKSSKLTVSVNGKQNELNRLDDFSLELKGAPEGSYIQGVNASNQVKTIKATDALKLSDYKEFYVIVPVAKVTEATKNFTVQVDSNFIIKGGYYYKHQGEQTVTTLEDGPYSNSNGVELKINYKPDTPNTAMNASRSIYLIGLIVLLSGLGILYVNIWKQQKQN